MIVHRLDIMLDLFKQLDMKEKTLQYWIDFLEKEGYHICEFGAYTFMCGELRQIELVDNFNHEIVIQCEFTEDYINEIESLPENEEYEIDFNKCIVDFISIASDICSEPNFMSGENEGMILSNVQDNDYHTHQLTEESLMHCIWIQRHQDLQFRELCKSYIKNMDIAEQIILPVLVKYDFYCDYMNYLDRNESNDTSDLFSVYKHDFTTDTVELITDCIDGSFHVNDMAITEATTSEEFENFLIDTMIMDDLNRPKLVYEYLFSDDPKYTKDSYPHIFNIFDLLLHNGIDINESHKTRMIASLDVDKIPKKYMDHYDKVMQLS